MSEITFAIDSYDINRKKAQSVSRYLQLHCYHKLAMVFHHWLDYKVHVVPFVEYSNRIWDEVLHHVRYQKDVPQLIIVVCKNETEIEQFHTFSYKVKESRNFGGITNSAIKMLLKAYDNVHFRSVMCQEKNDEIPHQQLDRIFNSFFKDINLIKEQKDMALKRSKTFKVMSIIPETTQFFLRKTKEIIEKESSFVENRELTEDTKFVVCFTSSITRNYDDHVSFLEQILKLQSEYDFYILFIDLYSFDSEVSELKEVVYEDEKKSSHKYCFNPKCTWTSVKVQFDKATDDSMNRALMGYLEKLRSHLTEEKPTLQAISGVSKEDYDRGLYVIQSQITNLQNQINGLISDNMKINTVIRENVKTVLDETKPEFVNSIIETVTPLIQTIILEQLKSSTAIQDVVKGFETLVLGMKVTYSEMIERKIDEKVQKLLSSVDRRLEQKFSENPTFDQYVEEAIKLPSGLSDEIPQEVKPMTSDDYYRAVIEHLQDRKYDGGLHCVVFSTEQSFEELMEKFKTTLDLSIEEFYNQHQEIFLTKDNKTYGMNRIGGICDTYDFYKVIDLLQTPQDEIRRAALKQSRFLKIVRDYFMKQFGFIVTWLAE